MFKDWAGCGVYGRFRLDGKAAVAAGLLQVPLSLQPPHCVAVAGSAALRIPNAGVAISIYRFFLNYAFYITFDRFPKSFCHPYSKELYDLLPFQKNPISYFRFQYLYT